MSLDSTVDDDLVYRPFLVERLCRAQLDRPAARFTFFVHDVGRLRCLTRVEAFAARALRNLHLAQGDLWMCLYLRVGSGGSLM